MKKRFLAVLVFALFINISAAASMVSFFVIETGLPESRGAYSDHSVQWENAFMDVFFDEGYIVSNFPMMRFEEKPQTGIIESVGIDIKEAGNWGIDYILIAQLDYSDINQPPSGITLFVYKVNTNEKIHESRIEGRTYRSVREEHDSIRSVIKSLVPYVVS